MTKQRNGKSFLLPLCCTTVNNNNNLDLFCSSLGSLFPVFYAPLLREKHHHYLVEENIYGWTFSRASWEEIKFTIFSSNSQLQNWMRYKILLSGWHKKHDTTPLTVRNSIPCTHHLKYWIALELLAMPRCNILFGAVLDINWIKGWLEWRGFLFTPPDFRN